MSGRSSSPPTRSTSGRDGSRNWISSRAIRPSCFRFPASCRRGNRVGLAKGSTKAQHARLSSPGLTGRPGIPESRPMGARSFYVYILASRIGGTLYIGVTNNLIRRVAEHRLKSVKGFTKKYEVDRLVYFEQFDDAEKAIGREKQLKKWNRAWKIRLIEEVNPNWDDLYSGIAGA